MKYPSDTFFVYKNRRFSRKYVSPVNKCNFLQTTRQPIVRPRYRTYRELDILRQSGLGDVGEGLVRPPAFHVLGHLAGGSGAGGEAAGGGHPHAHVADAVVPLGDSGQTRFGVAVLRLRLWFLEGGNFRSTNRCKSILSE